MKDKGTLLGGALFSQARYGALARRSMMCLIQRARRAGRRRPVQRINDLMSYPHKVFYYGKRAQ
jgi:hypothetical protein